MGWAQRGAVKTGGPMRRELAEAVVTTHRAQITLEERASRLEGAHNARVTATAERFRLLEAALGTEEGKRVRFESMGVLARLWWVLSGRIT